MSPKLLVAPGRWEVVVRTLAAVDPIVIGTGLLAVLAVVVALMIGIRARRRRKAAATTEAALRFELSTLETRAATLAAGEREAAWSTRALADALDRSLAQTDEALAAVATLEAEAAGRERELDALRDELRATGADLAGARRDLDAAGVQIANLETEIAALHSDDLTQRISDLEAQLGDARSAVATHAAEARELRHRLDVAEGTLAEPGTDGAPRHADLLARISQLEDALADLLRASMTRTVTESSGLRDEVADLRAQVAALRAGAATAEADAARLRHESGAARGELDRLRSAADSARQEADTRVAAAAARIAEVESAARTGTHDAATLVAREARIADLEQRLAGVMAARSAELRALNEKIAAMERLYVDVELRDRRIAALEEELKDTAESRDAALAELVRLEAEAVDLRAAAAAASASLERLGGIERDLIAARAHIDELEQQVAGTALGEEVARLRASLAAERDRADRAVQRAALAEPQDPTYAAYDRRLRERVAEAVDSATEALRGRIERLQAVVAEKERRLAILGGAPEPAPSGPDDLTRIRGIGPKIASILQGLGVTTFREIAEFTDDDVDRVGSMLPVYGRRIVDDDWIGQARALAR